ncbi:MAG: murein hydrolase activator EnvC family protein [Acidimicrobiia bacterium]
MFIAFAIAAVCLAPPVNGPVVAGYSPVGQYGGHWGVDFLGEVGDVVRAPLSGRVTFAGSVAGMKTITIEPVSGFKVSLSYLSEIRVASGSRISRGSTVALAGAPHGRPGVHLSTRIDGRYVDPASQMGCRDTDISRALRLVTPPRPYPRRRANWNSRRDLRPHPHRPPPHRRMCTAPAWPGSGPHRPRR